MSLTISRRPGLLVAVAISISTVAAIAQHFIMNDAIVHEGNLSVPGQAEVATSLATAAGGMKMMVPATRRFTTVTIAKVEADEAALREMGIEVRRAQILDHLTRQPTAIQLL